MKQKTSNRIRWGIVSILGALIFVFAVQTGSFLFLNSHHDEMEHLMSAFWTAGGFVPYRDFFQHHHPGLWYLLAPFFGIVEKPLSVLYIGRILMLLFFIGNCFFLTRIVRCYGGMTAAVITLFLYLSVPVTYDLYLHIRPDQPMVFCLLAGIYFWACFYEYRRPRDLILSYLSLWFSFFCLQKAALFLIPFGVYQLFLIIRREIPVSVFVKALIVPSALTIGYVVYLIATGTLTDYWELNWLLNAVWFRDYVTYTLSGADIVFMISGLFCFVMGAVRGTGFVRHMSWVGLGYGALFFILPRPYSYYYLPWVTVTVAAVGIGLGRLTDAGGLKTIWSGVILSVFVFSGMILLFFPNRRTVFYFPQMQYLEEHMKPGDEVITFTYLPVLMRGAPQHYYWFSLHRGAVTDARRFHRCLIPDLNEYMRRNHPRFVVRGIIYDYESSSDAIKGRVLMQTDPVFLRRYYRPTRVPWLYEHI